MPASRRSGSGESVVSMRVRGGVYHGKENGWGKRMPSRGNSMYKDSITKSETEHTIAQKSGKECGDVHL